MHKKEKFFASCQIAVGENGHKVFLLLCISFVLCVMDQWLMQLLGISCCAHATGTAMRNKQADREKEEERTELKNKKNNKCLQVCSKLVEIRYEKCLIIAQKTVEQ